MLNTASRHPALRPSPEVMPWGASTDRAPWVAACANRLAALRPATTWSACFALAQSLWSGVGHYDPVIAAELEHESSFDDDLA